MKPKEKKLPPRVHRPIPVLNADFNEGLSPQEVKLRQMNGLSNKQPPTTQKPNARSSRKTYSPFLI